jgi:hypothetical protein
MARFPVDASKRNVIRALEHLGFRVLREKEHISNGKGEPRRVEHSAHHAEPPANQVLNSQDNLHSSRNFTGGVPRRLRKPVTTDRSLDLSRSTAGLPCAPASPNMDSRFPALAPQDLVARSRRPGETGYANPKSPAASACEGLAARQRSSRFFAVDLERARNLLA